MMKIDIHCETDAGGKALCDDGGASHMPRTNREMFLFLLTTCRADHACTRCHAILFGVKVPSE